MWVGGCVVGWVCRKLYGYVGRWVSEWVGGRVVGWVGRWVHMRFVDM